MFYSKSKPAHCPSCGSKRIVDIKYGVSSISKEIQKEIDDEKTVVGGCCHVDYAPLWHCLHCKIDIYHKKDFTFAEKIVFFNEHLEFNGKLPAGIRVMNPFKENPEAILVSNQFYDFFYSDYKERHLILGINPGRFGAGITGVPFTDTKRMWDRCGIEIKGFESHEPSSVFIYDVIDAYGGPVKFYSDFYINSVCPLGFTTIGKNRKEVNYNYYDSKELTNSVYDFIIENINKQLKFPILRDVCYCLGTGKNFEFLSKLNNENNFFKKIIPLDHPRFVMQYKSKYKVEYIKKYIEELKFNR